MEMILSAIAIEIIVFAGVSIVLMGIVGWYVRRRTAIVIRVLAIALKLYVTADLYRVCRAEPLVELSGDTGAVTFPCDVPLGFIFHFFDMFAGPISVPLLIAAIWRQYGKLARYL